MYLKKQFKDLLGVRVVEMVSRRKDSLNLGKIPVSQKCHFRIGGKIAVFDRVAGKLASRKGVTI